MKRLKKTKFQDVKRPVQVPLGSSTLPFAPHFPHRTRLWWLYTEHTQNLERAESESQGLEPPLCHRHPRCDPQSAVQCPVSAGADDHFPRLRVFARCVACRSVARDRRHAPCAPLVPSPATRERRETKSAFCWLKVAEFPVLGGENGPRGVTQSKARSSLFLGFWSLV